MIFLYLKMKEGRKALFLIYRTNGENAMNVWLFAGCMFLVAVFLNMLLLFGHRLMKKRRSKKWKRETEIVD
ncbi:hypothetical protein COE99_25375 [Bacillus toyonensis]|nr:hypothetical protein COE99_25375 [Bacillus toyonensis]